MAAIGTATVAASLMVGHNVNGYWGQNVGVTWGTAGGCEVWPGYGPLGILEADCFGDNDR